MKRITIWAALLVLLWSSLAVAQTKPVTYPASALQSAQAGNANGGEISVDGFSSLSVTITIAGTATVNPEVSQDQSTWAAAVCIEQGDSTFTALTTVETTKVIRCNIAGMVKFRARTSGNTGSVTVTATASPGVMGGGGGAGGGGGGAPVTWASLLASGAMETSESLIFKIRGSGAQSGNGRNLYQHSSGAFFDICVTAEVENDCNYIRQLASGKKLEVTNSSGTAILTLTESTGALTNVKYDTEGTGNVFTVKRYIWLPAGGCQNTTASSVLDLPTSNPAVAACRTGSNFTKGVLDFADGSDLSAQFLHVLNDDWTGIIEGTVFYEANSTSTNNTVWQVAIACAGDGDSDDPALTYTEFAADAGKSTAHLINKTAATTITTTGTCTALDLMHVSVRRNSAHASDNLAATAKLIGVLLRLREAQ